MCVGVIGFLPLGPDRPYSTKKLVITCQEEPNGLTSKVDRCVNPGRFNCVLYLKSIPCSSQRLVQRLVVESPAMNMESKEVFFWEFGCSTLHSCRFNLKLQ